MNGRASNRPSFSHSCLPTVCSPHRSQRGQKSSSGFSSYIKYIQSPFYSLKACRIWPQLSPWPLPLLLSTPPSSLWPTFHSPGRPLHMPFPLLRLFLSETFAWLPPFHSVSARLLFPQRGWLTPKTTAGPFALSPPSILFTLPFTPYTLIQLSASEHLSYLHAVCESS